jgi:hypothetical protein
MRLQIQFLHPDSIEPSRIWEFVGGLGLPDELLEGIGRMTVPWLINENTTHDGKTRTETIRVAHTEKGEKRWDKR